MKVNIQLVKAFTKDKTGGNPAGVIYGADQLSAEQMQAIAKTLGFSESAFIQHSDQADYKVRFFATKQEVDFCGHATVATFHYLGEKGLIDIKAKASPAIISQETKADIFPVTCYPDGKIMMAQGDPHFGEIEIDRKLIAGLLGLDEKELGNTPLQTVTTSVPKLIIPIASRAALQKAKPDLEAISNYTKQGATRGLYLFTSAASEQADFITRSFNPLVGINEDPATGVAAGPLACYANEYIFSSSKKQFTIKQGFEIGAPSTIYVDLSDGVLVGGYAATFGRKELEV